MLNIILESGHYALYDSKNGSPLTVALQNNCFDSIHIIMNGDFKFDVQMTDAQGQSFVGYLIKKMLENPEQSGLEFDKLDDFSNNLFKTLDLDMHKKQFANIGTVKKQISAWQLVFKSLRHHRTIRLANRRILEYAFRKGDFTLDADEKNTLFKSSVKAVLSFGRDARSSWSQLSILCKSCGVNIFETKDSLGKGVEHRLIKNWPIKIKRSNELEAYFKPFATE